jgi:hypothetical protein
MGFLEREIAKLTLVVEHLCTAVERDRENAESRRAEVLEYMKTSNERSEKIQEQLAAQISKIVSDDIATKTQLAAQQAQWGLIRWVFTGAVGVLGVVIAYKSGWDHYPSSPSPYLQPAPPAPQPVQPPR